MKQAHGGQLRQACQSYGGQPKDWLDLSTGIAPWAFPLPNPPTEVWQRLPEDEDELLTIASHYYQVAVDQALPVSGSQWAIETIPKLYAHPLRVAILAHGYSEHLLAWSQAGHEVVWCHGLDELYSQATTCDAAVIINPHNPLGITVSREALTDLKQKLRQGILVVDMAFADATELAQPLLMPNTWVLRSVGKFFGLAGIRLGFVLAVPEQIAQLAQAQSPWAVNHLARWAASLALADQAWQAQQRDRLVSQQERLLKRLDQHHFRVLGSCAFFAIITDPDHQALFTSACEAHILLRHFPELQALRLGLPQREGDWYRLEQWMAKVKG